MKTIFTIIFFAVTVIGSGQTLTDAEREYNRIPRAASEFEESMRSFGRNPSYEKARSMSIKATSLRVTLINFILHCENQENITRNSEDVKKAYLNLASKMREIYLYKLENLCELVQDANCFTSPTRCNYSYRYDDVIKEYNREYIEGMNRASNAYSELKRVLKLSDLHRLSMAFDESARFQVQEEAKLNKENASQNQNTTQKQNTTKTSLPLAIQELEKSMVYVDGGTFIMGCTSEQGVEECGILEKPATQKHLKEFMIGKFEVTQAQWIAVMGSNPSNFNDCNNCPVENVSWVDVQQFLQKLNQITGKNYRLPYEAEWEFAARGGNKTQKFKYSGSANLNSVAWYSENSSSRTHPVGQKQANELGLFDMTGNVFEWCLDGFKLYDNSGSPSTEKVIRGGAFNFNGARLSFRTRAAPETRINSVGFRIVLPQ